MEEDQDAHSGTDDCRGGVSQDEEPLINTDPPLSSVPSKGFQRLVVGMCLVFLFIVEVSQLLITPALQQVLEDRLCGEVYPDHELGRPEHLDDRCKEKSVQKELAILRSWEVSAEMFVLSLPKVFSVWSILYGNIVYLVGGGTSMASAMIWTLIADAIPIAERTSVFYLLYATALILAVVVNPISALLVTTNPWIALWLALAILFTSIFASFLTPETLGLCQSGANSRWRSSSFNSATSLPLGPPRTWIRRAVLVVKNEVHHIWRYIFASKTQMLLIAAYTLSRPTQINQLLNMLHDLLLSRLSVLFLISGSLLTAFAASPGMFITSLVITNLGSGFPTLCRALLNAIVEPHAVATLNTTVSAMETIMGEPLFNPLVCEINDYPAFIDKTGATPDPSNVMFHQPPPPTRHGPPFTSSATRNPTTQLTTAAERTKILNKV
ncbi:hypothetical protein E4U42_002543 [Claviceps africana]|uniref:MFS transporter n=1 Tax=Claviceps africana TaxID=83212 RepID=A0A8K0NHE2_9HYPO|nr:hypothetical protein E4U42_002543 [Claviceps africana]